MSDVPDRDMQFRSMTVAAVGLHELFCSYIEAGFSRQEAFELCKSIMQATVAMQRPAEG